MTGAYWSLLIITFSIRCHSIMYLLQIYPLSGVIGDSPELSVVSEPFKLLPW
jgi:hypothetical protein